MVNLRVGAMRHLRPGVLIYLKSVTPQRFIPKHLVPAFTNATCQTQAVGIKEGKNVKFYIYLHKTQEVNKPYSLVGKTSPENQMGLKPGQSKTVLTGQIMVTGEINIFVLAFKVMTI